MKILTEIGLNEYESKAYETLTKHGKSSASKISTHSGVPYGRIYDILSSLEQKGLVKTLPGMKKEYVAGDPQRILDLLEKRKKEINEGEQKIKELKKYYDSSYKEPVLVATGQKNFYLLMNETVHPKKNYVYAVKYNAEPKPEWMRKDREKIAKGLDVRNLVRYDSETKSNIAKWKGIKIPIKKMDNEGVAMMIHNDEEVLIGLIKSNTTLLIRDKAFAKIMKHMYLNTWDKSDKIN
ncbi:MAG: TrmB family transcriptional regulator [Candidatus Nanoarchaeia archaeon]